MSFHQYRRRVKCIEQAGMNVLDSQRRSFRAEEFEAVFGEIREVFRRMERMERMAKRNFEQARRRKADREAV